MTEKMEQYLEPVLIELKSAGLPPRKEKLIELSMGMALIEAISDARSDGMEKAKEIFYEVIDKK